MTKKIYINGRFLTQNMTGINRFGYEICRSLAKLGIDFEVLVPNGVKEDYDLSSINVRTLNLFSSHLWEQITLPLFLIGKNALLINFSGLGPIFKTEQIITIHDLSFKINPSWFSKSYYFFYNLFTPIVARKAEKILTVSEFSKKEIERLLGVPPHKISVVYNAVSDSFLQKEAEVGTTDLSQPYILAVFSLDPRKNIDVLIQAYKESKIEIPLYVIGGGNSVFGDLKIKNMPYNIKFLGRVSDEELVAYYKNATLFVYPSLYEGFGLPPLEALMCGCRNVLLSDLEVFHEVYGDNVNYVEGDSVNSLSAAMNKALLNENKSPNIEELRKRYSWDLVAQKIKEEIYKTL